jgi:hypothetical protein
VNNASRLRAHASPKRARQCETGETDQLQPNSWIELQSYKIGVLVQSPTPGVSMELPLLLNRVEIGDASIGSISTLVLWRTSKIMGHVGSAPTQPQIPRYRVGIEDAGLISRGHGRTVYEVYNMYIYILWLMFI